MEAERRDCGRVVVGLRGEGRVTTYPATIKWAAIAIMLCISSPASSGEEEIPVLFGCSGATNAKPLSKEWLDYWGSKYPWDDGVGARLVTELVTSDGANSDPWSTLTESELRAAISNDDNLSRNTWNTVRCSRNGCIAAIDPVDRLSNHLIATLRFRLLSNMTPRGDLSHKDFTMAESDAIPGKKIPSLHLLFFIFPAVLNPPSEEIPSQHPS